MHKPRSVDSREAVILGLHEAFVLNHFRVWIKRCHSAKVSDDGFRVAFMSRRELHEQLPFISPKSLQRAVAKLERLGILRAYSGTSPGRRNRTKWYAVDDEKVKSCLGHGDPNMEKCLGHGDPNYYIEKGYSSLEKDSELRSQGPGLTAGSFPEETSGRKKMGKLELEQIHKNLVAKKLDKKLVPKPLAVAEHWRLICSLNYNDMAKITTPKDKELGMWKHILSDDDLRGREKPFLQFVVERWKDSTQTIKAHDGVAVAPTRPNVAYLLVHLHKFIQLFDNGTGGTEVLQSSKVNISAQEETTKPLPTYAEAMAAMKSTGVSNDEHGGTSNSA